MLKDPMWRFIFGVFGVSLGTMMGLVLLYLRSASAGWTLLSAVALIIVWFIYSEKRADERYREWARPRSAGMGVSSMTDTSKAQALLAIVQEVYDGGKGIIDRRWTVLDKMAALAAQNDIAGMVRYFENCKRSERGQRVRRKLERAGKKSLESEEARFMAIVREERQQ